MFFTRARDARIYAALEIIRTKRNHKVVPCKKYLCPPKECFGRDYRTGFTVILDTKG